MWAANAPTSEIIAKVKNNGAASPQRKSTGKVNPHASPIISEAELAGKNSGLETVSQNREVLVFFGSSLLIGNEDIYYWQVQLYYKSFFA